MTAAKKTTKPVAKKAAPKKLTMNLKTGSIKVKDQTKADQLEATLKAQGPFIHKAPAAPSKTVAKKTVEKVEKGETKMDRARAIMTKHYGKLKRKEIIQLFVSEAGLTIAGSGTYYAVISADMKK